MPYTPHSFDCHSAHPRSPTWTSSYPLPLSLAFRCYTLPSQSPPTPLCACAVLHRLHQSIPPRRRWQRRMAWVAQMLYTRVLVGYAPLGFILLRADLTFTVWRSLYFFGSILPLLLSVLLPPLIPPSNRRKKDQ
ncbi:unnamed protein product [Closterium sp. NIES-53]